MSVTSPHRSLSPGIRVAGTPAIAAPVPSYANGSRPDPCENPKSAPPRQNDTTACCPRGSTAASLRSARRLARLASGSAAPSPARGLWTPGTTVPQLAAPGDTHAAKLMQPLTDRDRTM
jgi:hypothetical protein